MYTTLEEIKGLKPCEDSYKELLKGLNKTKADSEPLEFRSIYNILNVDDLMWATAVLPKKQRVHIGALFADSVKHLTKDKRVHDCIDTCFAYARGEATESDLRDASEYAYYASEDAYYGTIAYYAADVAYYATCATASSSYITAVVITAIATTAYRRHKEKLARMFLNYIEEV